MKINEEQGRNLLRQYDEGGFGYVDCWWAQNRLPSTRFGLTLTHPDWVRAKIDEHSGLKFVSHRPKAWCPPGGWAACRTAV